MSAYFSASIVLTMTGEVKNPEVGLPGCLLVRS